MAVIKALSIPVNSLGELAILPNLKYSVPKILTLAENTDGCLSIESLLGDIGYITDGEDIIILNGSGHLRIPVSMLDSFIEELTGVAEFAKGTKAHMR